MKPGIYSYISPINRHVVVILFERDGKTCWRFQASESWYPITISPNNMLDWPSCLVSAEDTAKVS